MYIGNGKVIIFPRGHVIHLSSLFNNTVQSDKARHNETKLTTFQHRSEGKTEQKRAALIKVHLIMLGEAAL